MNVRGLASFVAFFGWWFTALAVHFAAEPRPCFAQLPAARLDTLWPVGASAGTEFDLVLDGGEFLDEARVLFPSHAAFAWSLQTAQPRFGRTEPEARDGHFRVQLPADFPEGMVEIRTGGRYGVSNPRRFWVSRLPTLTPVSPRSTVETAFAVSVNSIVQGRCSSEQVDHYRLALAAGQRIRLLVRALSLDSAASVMVVVRDADGKELHRGRSSKATDALTHWTAPHEGSYLIQVFDQLYRGGNDYHYQLQIDDSRRSGSPSPETSPIVAAQKPVSPEPSSTGARVGFPSETLGYLASSGLPARFDAALVAGKPVTVEVHAKNIDSDSGSSASDMQLVVERLITDPQGTRGERIAEIDDTNFFTGSLLEYRNRDPVFFFQPPVDSDYRFIVRDLQTGRISQSDPAFVLRVREAQPDFILRALVPHESLNPAQSLHHGVLLRRGQSIAIEVGIIPKEGFFEDMKGQIELVKGLVTIPYDVQWKWPVEVTVGGLPEGITALPARLDKHHRRSFIIVSAAETAPAWQGPITLTASIKTEQSQWDRAAEPLEIRRPDPQGRGELPIESTDRLFLAVTDLEAAPLKIQCNPPDNPQTITVKRAAPLKLAVSIVRSEGMQGKVTLRPAGLPADVQVPELALEGGNLQGELQMNIGANAPVGPFRFFLNGEMEGPWPRNPQALVREQSYLKDLEGMLASAAEDAKGTIEQAIQQAKERVKTLEESTKPQNTRIFVLSNTLEIHVDVP